METTLYFFNQNQNNLLILIFICIILGYFFGSIPIAYLYSKAHGVDILHFGSGNPGSTNVGRALGKTHGRIVFILDILKIIIPILIIEIVYFVILKNFKYADGNSLYQLRFYSNYIAIYTGLGGIIGHNFPIFLNFKGGKGISCTMGAIFSFSIAYSMMLFLCYKIITKITKYVSVGSIGALTVLLVSASLLSYNNLYPFYYSNNGPIGILLLPGIFLMWLSGIIRHKDNIKRLIDGTENKIGD